LRAITSQNLDDIFDLPFLYICCNQPDVMRSWGVAHAATLGDYERLYPGALVAPRYAGATAQRGDLLYDGAEPAADFMPSNTRAPS
jgi:alpha-N-acetylglucosamine transferase